VSELKDLFVWLKELCMCGSSTSEYELKDFCVRVAKDLCRSLRTSGKELKDLC
jgi:hypothetical protein